MKNFFAMAIAALTLAMAPVVFADSPAAGAALAAPAG